MVVRVRMNNGDGTPMSCLKQLRDLLQEAYCHVTDEKKLPLTFMGVPFGQELLHAQANLSARRLLIFQFIDDDGLKAGGTHLKQFSCTASIGERKCCQSRGKEHPSVERLRFKEHCARGLPSPC